MSSTNKRKGKKGMRGVPILHDEVKKTHGLDLTDTAWDAIGEAAKSLGVSRSELVERLGRKGESWLVAALTDEVTEPSRSARMG